jgi:hypothetical protein
MERVIAAAVAPTTWKRVADVTTEIARGFKGNAGRKKADAEMRFDRRLNDLEWVYAFRRRQAGQMWPPHSPARMQSAEKTHLARC